MPINAHPDYLAAEKRYLEAKNDEERIQFLEDMIRKAPSHKGAENLRAELKTRLKKLKEKIIKSKKSGKSTKDSIKKADMQAVLIGFTNSGKSTLLTKLTNAHAKISEHNFTTTKPEIGTMNYEGVQIQIIDQPSLKNENFDIGIVNTADLLLLVITKFEDIPEIENNLNRAKGKRLIVFNKIDLLDDIKKRKVYETLKSRRYNFIMISSITEENINELKERIFGSFDITRIYLKEPGKQPTDRPLMIKSGSSVEDVAKKISKEMVPMIKEVRIWGPSSKFPNQKVGLNHKVKDKDIIEFKTK